MDVGSSQSPALPSGWRASQATPVGVDLRVNAGRRNYLAAGVTVLAMIAGWRALANWKIATEASIALWVGITVALSLLAIWCAFADELWHIERNHIAHKVGIGPMTYSRSYHNSELQIIVRFSTNFSVPYYRLYAVRDSEPHFLLERGEQELRQLATFISFHTGWTIRPFAPSTEGVMPA